MVSHDDIREKLFVTLNDQKVGFLCPYNGSNNKYYSKYLSYYITYCELFTTFLTVPPVRGSQKTGFFQKQGHKDFTRVAL